MRFFFLSVLITIPSFIIAQAICPCDTFPIPPRSKYDLFYLQRQPNANTIVVELNVHNANVADDNPVHVYWIRYTEQRQKAELNFIQKTFAYGIKSKKIIDGVYELHFVSYSKLKLQLERDANNVWRVFYKMSNGNRMILKRVYLHVHGGTFWHPNVEYTELKGVDPVNYKEIKERIILK